MTYIHDYKHSKVSTPSLYKDIFDGLMFGGVMSLTMILLAMGAV